MEKSFIKDHFKGHYEDFYGRYLSGIRKGNGDQYGALCRFHSDREPSFSFNAVTGLFHCHGCKEQGDAITFYAKVNDLDKKRDYPKVLAGIAEEFGIRGNGEREARPRVVCRYDYQDESGRLVYQIERLNPKSFRIRRPNGNGNGSTYDSRGVAIVPYRLPELLKADEVLVTEGEKDADALAVMGFVATTNPFGAGKWPDHFGPFFAGKHVVLIPDNDKPGRDHMRKVAANLREHAASLKWLALSGLPEKGDVSDWGTQFRDGADAAERLSILIEETPIYQEQQHEAPPDGLRFIDAAEWLSSDPPEPDQILECVIDAGDKMAILASSKMRKSFLLLQGALSLAAGREFLGWEVPKPRRVLYCQFEIREHHNHRRVKNLAKAMGILPSDLGNRLRILNGRGLGIDVKDGFEKVTGTLGDFAPEVICFDPLYKVAGGVENAAEDMKVVLSAFDELAEKTGAAIMYVHHDAKGSPGDRDIRDRGAGSNVLGRDYDACLTLTAHASDPDATVVEVLLRNYRPQEPFSILWNNDDSGGYCFKLAPDMIPEKKTSKTKPPPPALSTYLPVAEAILSDQPMDIGPFKTEFREQTGLSDKRCREFMSWATAGGRSPLVTHEDRGKGHHKKWIERRNR